MDSPAKRSHHAERVRLACPSVPPVRSVRQSALSHLCVLSSAVCVAGVTGGSGAVRCLPALDSAIEDGWSHQVLAM